MIPDIFSVPSTKKFEKYCSSFKRKIFIEILMGSHNIGINKQFLFNLIINYYGISTDPSLGKMFNFFLN